MGFPGGEHLRQNFQKMNTPLADPVGMDAELARDLGDRLLPLNRFQGDFGLEGHVVSLSHADHNTIPPYEIWQAQNAPKPPVQFLGATSERVTPLSESQYFLLDS